MKPEMILPINENKYVYAFCKCPSDISFAIRIKRKPGVSKYPFKCDICGTEGEVITGKGIMINE